MDNSFVEQAEKVVQDQVDDQVFKSRKQALPDKNLEPQDYIRVDCENCGDDLPVFRMQKGQLLCTICQQAKELKRFR